MSKKHKSEPRNQSATNSSLTAFELFDIKMTRQLDRLVARWQHTAAPMALRSDRQSTIYAKRTHNGETGQLDTQSTSVIHFA